MGQGYIRNDGANNIANGNVIDAADLDGEFDAVVAAFDSATGHTHDGTTAEGGVITVVGPAQEYVSSGTSFHPKTDDTYDLGSATNEWKDLYVDGIAYIDAVNLAGVSITATGTELNYMGGVTSAVQTQLDAKQASDADLTAIAALAKTDGNFIVGNGSAWVAESGATVRTSLGLGTAATTASTDYATAAQGVLADSAVQPNSSPTLSGLTVNGTATATAYAGDGSGLTNIARKVWESSQGSGSSANYWAKVATYSISSDFDDGTFIYHFMPEELGAGMPAIVAVNVRTNNASGGDSHTLNVELMSKPHATPFSDDSFKLIDNGGSSDIELWVKKNDNNCQISAYEMSAHFEDSGFTIAYNQNAAWQASEPTGSGLNIKTVGVKVAGNFNVTGSISVSGTVDGRDVAADGTKLDGIEASADVTDTANVTAAGALMDSELTSIASVKAMNQGVATTDSPTFATVTTTAVTGDGSGLTSLSSANLTGALPAIDGSALTGIIAGVVFARKTTTYTAAHLEGVIADTSGGTFTVTLPATPSTGDYVVLVDGDDWSAINLTVGRNGSTIEGDAADMTMDIGGVQVTFIYDGTTWQIYTTAASDSSAFATAAQGALADSAVQPADIVASVAVYVDAAGGSSVDSTSDVTIPATTTEIEDSTNYSNTSGVVTVTDAGTYVIKGTISVTATTASYRWTGELSIVKNSSTVVGLIQGGYVRVNGGADETYLHIDKMIALSASDTIELKVKRLSTTTGNGTLVADTSTLQLLKL